jgi:glycosyltransferase involved in cell wall biosynthesis
VDKILRIAYFPDSFNEVNGIALTSNKLVEYAKVRDYPFLCVHAGPETKVWKDGSVTYLSLKRSPLSFSLDEGLKYDPFFHRHYRRAKAELQKFGADVIHITGLNDVGWLGMHLSRMFELALIGSWHTNLHEYASLRLKRRFRFLPAGLLSRITGNAERGILKGSQLFYKIPHVVLAPNRELVEMLAAATGRRSKIMARGVDTDLFSPAKRTVDDGVFRLGFVGRLRAEKDVRILPELAKKLVEAGKTNFEFLIVGEGSERQFLEENIERAQFPGFLSGEPLAAAYANMDVFVFPSETDTFGNVIQEAAASGVPSIVTEKGGPKFLVGEGETGFVAADLDMFAQRIIELMDDAEQLSRMKGSARDFALKRSWDSVFDGVYDAYGEAWEYLERRKELRKEKLSLDRSY